MDMNNIKYGIAGGIAAAVATIIFFLKGCSRRCFCANEHIHADERILKILAVVKSNIVMEHCLKSCPDRNIILLTFLINDAYVDRIIDEN
jgi:hypothetical protein